ncbi:hypothetical protein B194_3415 [Serratia plymuthica A30]|nr:hypothetical protein B194_3415 [Serratia plymuthica A30]
MVVDAGFYVAAGFFIQTSKGATITVAVNFNRNYYHLHLDFKKIE